MTLRARRLAIGGAGAVLIVAAIMARTDDSGETTAAPVARRGGAAAAARDDVPVADVKLELLQRTRPEIEEAQRNLFRFEARAAPSAPAGPRAQPAASGPSPDAPSVAAPSGPPPPPPIAVRFIGLVDAPTQAGRIAILVDGRGNVFYGKEGGIIEGRYRVLKVGPEAAELSYLDGRGRQTIRLSGQ